MLEKLHKCKKIANKHGELLSDFSFKADYFKDITITMELNEAGIKFTKIKSKDFETYYYIID